MNSAAIREVWVRTDEDEDVAGSIRHCGRCLSLIAEDDQIWKWVALSLHSALQGSCVCHLTTTAVPLGAVTKENAEEWVEYFEASRTDRSLKPPRTYLMPLPDLLKAIRKARSAGDASNEAGVPLSDSELHWLRRLHEDVRNEFTHFSPKGWSIDVSGVPGLIKLAVRLIRDIADCGWAFRHKDEGWLEKFLESLNELENSAAAL